MKRINLGLFGFGKVGCGVVKVLRERGSLLKRKAGIELHLKRICDQDIKSARLIKVRSELLTTKFDELLNDPQIDIIIELIGGIHPAKEIIIKALRKGKHIVTANKALLAGEAKALFKLASRYKKKICFEASVCAGIPIIRALREGLAANRIRSIFGIINGTSNFILSKMLKENCEFREALSEARLLGIAEKNPSLDIEGMDSAHKLIILTLLGFQRFVNIKDIFIEGISHIRLADVRYAQELGYIIKLLAIAKKTGGELEVRVHPTLIPKGHPLSMVEGTFNALYVLTDLAGELFFFGEGAGAYPAASAVISDVIDLSCDIKSEAQSEPSLQFSPKKIRVRKINEILSRYYLRFMAIDKPGVLAKISGILGRYNISIAQVSQKERRRAKIVPVVMVTHEAKEKSLRRALEHIDRLAIVKPKSIAIRMEAL